MPEKFIFTPADGLAEAFVTLAGTPDADFRSEALSLLDRFRALAGNMRPVWLKFHLSDVTNQMPLLRPLLTGFGCSCCFIGQPPVNNAHIILEAWLLPDSVKQCGDRFELQNYTLNFFNTPEIAAKGSFDQMAAEFAAVKQKLAALGGNIPENLQRTWIYCRDVDNNYAPLVVARREFFARENLVPKTHYITSTGIEGTAEVPDRLVRMDSLALFGHEPEQIQYLRALENLSPTNIYGVTFERGTRIIYGDRSHSYISGTASIDKFGNILYERDVVKQCERVFENISALLAEGDTALSDFKQATVYLRDPADFKLIEPVLHKHLAPDALCAVVRGAVCRPGWLVEIEGIAVKDNGNCKFKPFV